MKKISKIAVIITLTQAVLLSTVVIALVPSSLAPAAYAEGCDEILGNPQGRMCGDPHRLGFGAPPVPDCGHKNSFKNSAWCRLESDR
jgi:hypothetical protein